VRRLRWGRTADSSDCSCADLQEHMEWGQVEARQAATCSQESALQHPVRDLGFLGTAARHTDLKGGIPCQETTGEG
jgi:hypothetical protein